MIMAELAIAGHKTRGKEVIEILEMLGGNNPDKLIANFDYLGYFIGKETRNIYLFHLQGFDSQNVIIFTLEEFLEKFPYKIGDKVSSKYLKNYEVSKMEFESVNNRVIYKLQGMGWYSADELQPYKKETMDKVNKAVFDANAQCCDIMNHLIKQETMEENLEQITLDIPDGYEFFGIDDNNKVVFTKKQSQYPKTYEECCKVLFPNSIALGKVLTSGYNCELLKKLGELLICRDAYWKIAGEQMGLDKPWKPDWLDNSTLKYCIYYVGDEIKKQPMFEVHHFLAFPTVEKRDMFYENFEVLIEACKEFL